MSVQRMAVQMRIATNLLGERPGGIPPRKLIAQTIDDVLHEVQQLAEAGSEVQWGTLHLEVGRDSKYPEALAVQATADVYTDDLVAGFTAMGLALHERRKEDGRG